MTVDDNTEQGAAQAANEAGKESESQEKEAVDELFVTETHTEANATWLYRICKRVVPNMNPRFSGITFLGFMKELLGQYRRESLRKRAMYSNRYGPLMAKKMRPKYYRKLGCNIGKNVYIGREVLLDPRWPDKITLEDNVTLGDRCIIVAHKRDMSKYHKGDWLMECPHIVAPVLLKKRAHVMVDCLILPGVTIGEGAVIGAGSLVMKDIPPHCIAVGRPAKVLKKIE